jgi:hypothetical protein
VQKLGKTFGVLALVFGLVAVILVPVFFFVFYFAYGSYVFYALAGLAIVFGIIGMIKDDSKGLGVVGLILGIVALVLWFVLPMILVGLLFGSLI